VDLETALTSLYQSSREEFIPARADLVKQARAAGQRDLAGQIAAARKPTVAAWLLNQVGHEYPADLDTIAELADALRAAHQELAADQLRALSQQRNDLLRTMDDRALRIARRANVTITAAVSEAVREAFTAALLDPAVLATLRTGRLSTVPGAEASTGWPTWDGIPATAPSKPPAAQRHAARRAEAEEEAALTEQARAEAEEALNAARQRAEEADAELAAARNRVEQARFEQRTAKLATVTAQHDYEHAERNARAARRALTDLA
jgi:hypothetical protein